MISYEQITQLSNDFFKENRARIMAEILKQCQCENEEELRRKDVNMAWGLDCGIVYLMAKNPETSKNWKDIGGYSMGQFRPSYIYGTQSTTIQQVQADLLLEYLEEVTSEKFYTYTWLD